MKSSSDPLAPVPAALPPQLRCALCVLLEAFNSTEVSQRDPWDFGVEIADLHAAGVTNAALRLLVCNGLVQHRVEKMKSGSRRRRFAELEALRFSDKSCFALTEAGVRAAHVLQGETVLSAAETPYWDDRIHTLFWRSRALYHFRHDAPYQEAVLRAFQAEEWLRSVTVALPEDLGVSRKDRLHDTIKNLNRNVFPHLRFRLEGSGRRVFWEPTATESRMQRC